MNLLIFLPFVTQLKTAKSDSFRLIMYCETIVKLEKTKNEKFTESQATFARENREILNIYR